MRSKNGSISSRKFYGRNTKEPKRSWARTSSGPKYRKESNGLLGWEAIKFYIMKMMPVDTNLLVVTKLVMFKPKLFSKRNE